MNAIVRMVLAAGWITASAGVAAAPTVAANPNVHFRLQPSMTALLRDPWTAKLYVGGKFDVLTSQNNFGSGSGPLRRLNPDGSLDSSWLPFPNTIGMFTPGHNALALDSTGRVYIGDGNAAGSLYFGNNQYHAGIARLSAANGSLDTSWLPERYANTNAIAVDASDNVLIGGASGPTTAGSTTVDGALVRVSSAGVLSGTWNPLPTSTSSPGVTVLALAVSGTAVFAGGDCLGASCAPVVKIDSSGTIISSWTSGADCYEAASLALSGTGALFVGCNISPSGARIFKLDGTTGAVLWRWPAATTFWGGTVNTLLRLGDGNVYAGGPALCQAPSPYCDIARFSEATGSYDASWPSVFVDEPITLVLRGAAHVGALTRGANLIDLPATVPTTPISYLADMYSFGTPRKVVCDPYQGRALVLGFFDSVDLYQRPHAALLNADGSLNTQWSLANYGYLNSDYYTYPGSPFSAAFDSDGSMVVSFGRPVGIGNTLYSMVRFSGSNMDPVLGWVPGIAPDQTINDIAIDASHRVYVAQPDGVRRLNGTNGNTDGWFAAQQVSGGAQKLQIASTRQLVYALEGPYEIFQQRVNAFSMGSGAQVGPLFPPADGGIPFDDIEDFALDPSGYIYVAGHYLGGGEGRYLAKMSPAGNLVTSWVGASTSFGYGAFTRFALAPMGSHWLYAANAGNSELGRYDMSNPGTRDGAFAPSTDSHSYYSGSIASLCETKDHRLLAAGDFYYVAGNSREGVVAFTDSDPLLNDRIFYHQFE